MIQNEYETIYVARPELTEDEHGRMAEKLSGIIDKFKGTVLAQDAWGRRQMAYPIEKHKYGHYTYLNYTGPAELPKELERLIRLEFNLIRFLTIKLGDDVAPDSLVDVAQARVTKVKERLASSADGHRDRDDRRDGRSSRYNSGAPKPEAGPTEAAAEPAAASETPAEPAEETAKAAPAESEEAPEKAEEPAAPAAEEAPATEEKTEE